jgi:hypothetical protein
LRISGSLDALLGNEEPLASFHDAIITDVQVDYSRKRFIGGMQLCVGDPDSRDEAARERRRRGELVVNDLTLWAIEPPDARSDGLDEGLVAGGRRSTGRRTDRRWKGACPRAEIRANRVVPVLQQFERVWLPGWWFG